MNIEYPFQVVWSPDDEAYLAITHQLPGCVADGPTPEEAVSNLRVIISEWLETAREQKRPIPEPMTSRDFDKQESESQKELQRYIEHEVSSAVLRVLEQIAASGLRQRGAYHFEGISFTRTELEPAGSRDR